MSDLEWLMAWYSAQCDGDWEHSYGIHLETLDNPGWSLAIDLSDTPIQDRVFERVEHNLQSQQGNWWVCWTGAAQFRAACGPLDLATVIEVFRVWVEAGPSPLAGEGVGEVDG